MRNPNAAALLALGVVCISIILAIVTVVRPWARARRAGRPVALSGIVGMTFRGSPPLVLIDAYIALVESGDERSLADVEKAYLLNKAAVKNAADLVRIIRQG